MSDDIVKDFTLIPEEYKRKDPRQLAALYPDQIRNTEKGFVTYNKYVSNFIYYHSLQTAEQVAKSFNKILVPKACLHWRRKELFSDHCIRVGRRTFYLLHPSELNDGERVKLLNYLDEEGLI